MCMCIRVCCACVCACVYGDTTPRPSTYTRAFCICASSCGAAAGPACAGHQRILYLCNIYIYLTYLNDYYSSHHQTTQVYVYYNIPTRSPRSVEIRAIQPHNVYLYYCIMNTHARLLIILIYIYIYLHSAYLWVQINSFVNYLSCALAHARTRKQTHTRRGRWSLQT